MDAEDPYKGWTPPTKHPVCKRCGALLGDIEKHEAWHSNLREVVKLLGEWIKKVTK